MGGLGVGVGSGWGRGCASAMGQLKLPSSCSSPKQSCNQIIHYNIRSRGVCGINHNKLRNFTVVEIECFFSS